MKTIKQISIMIGTIYLSSIYELNNEECEIRGSNMCKCVNSTEIQGLSEEEMISITNQYYEELKRSTSCLYDDMENTERLVDDIYRKEETFDEKLIIVLDVGGSYFKIALVKIYYENSNQKAKVIYEKKYSYPIKSPHSRFTFWFDWVAEKFVSLVIRKGFKPDYCSLIFSYPIRYAKNDMVFPVKFSKFWCFEPKTSLNMDILSYLNGAIKAECEKYENLNMNLEVKTVLNDSVATYFASKLINDVPSIGIVLGTGTNASFLIESTKQVYNSEWGTFVPKGIELLEEEYLLFDELNRLSMEYNYLDVLSGNGYKWKMLNIISNHRMLSLPETHPEDIKSILESEYFDTRRNILNGLINRSRQILVALTCSVIKLYNSEEVLLVLNGSGFDDINERVLFDKLINEFLPKVASKPIEVNNHYENGLTYIGAAYYAYAKQ